MNEDLAFLLKVAAVTVKAILWIIPATALVIAFGAMVWLGA
ncbi:MAG: hypothetical protein WBA15_12470 [Mesorhizobium sp.]